MAQQNDSGTTSGSKGKLQFPGITFNGGKKTNSSNNSTKPKAYSTPAKSSAPVAAKPSVPLSALLAPAFSNDAMDAFDRIMSTKATNAGNAGYAKGFSYDRANAPARSSTAEGSGDTGFLFDGTVPDYAAFLAAANSSSGSDGYAARIADAEKRKAEALAAISNGSQDLANKLSTSRDSQDAYYTQALQAQAAATAQAQQAQQNALSSIRATQDQSNANAGIQVDTSKMADDQAFAAKQLASQQAAYDASLRGNQTTNYALSSANIDAARGRGLEDQNTSRRTYDSAIAELLDAQAAAKASAASSSASGYNQALSQYNNDRDFAYQQYRDDKSDAFDLLKLQTGNSPTAESYTPYQQLILDLTKAGIKSPGTFAKRAMSDYIPSATGNQAGSFSKLFGQTNAQSQAAIRAYLKAAGLQ